MPEWFRVTDEEHCFELVALRSAVLMPLYYFHVRHEHGLVEDLEGIALADEAAVYAEAVRSALEFLAEAAEPGPMQLEITDAAGALVLKASLQDLANAWKHLARSRLPQLVLGRLVH